MTRLPIGPDDVALAAKMIRDGIVDTPTAMSKTLSLVTGADIVVKFENLQFTASYKERGALNRLLSLDADERERGVVAASAGNHAQAVAYHARRLGVTAVIVMPVATPNVKVANTRALDAQVVLHGETFDEAAARAHELEAEFGRVYIPPFDDPLVMAGQGTVALEMLDEHPDLDVLVVPVGGGGLAAGVAVAAKDRSPGIEIVGVQSERFPSMVSAMRGEPMACGGPTIAEGIAVVEAGILTRQVVAALVDEVVAVSEARIEEAICLYLEIEKVVAEGAGAAGLAAVLEQPERFRGRRTGLVVSGGNIDLRLLASVIMRGLARTGRLARLRIDVPDRPGALSKVTGLIGEAGGNIVDIVHERISLAVPTPTARVEVVVETSGPEPLEELVAALERAGYPTERVSLSPVIAGAG